MNEFIGQSEGYINKIESGYSLPSLSGFFYICEFLEVTPYEFFNYYIKDVVVRPEYQGKGIGRMLIDELRRFISNNGVKGTDIFVELCAVPDKIPFYEKFGFEANEAQRLKKFHHVE